MNTIVLVEDDKDFAELLSISLEKAGYSTKIAYNADEGLTVMDKKLPDLVLIDVMLPDKDGYECCKEIYKKWPHIPIVMLSAIRQSEEDKILGLESGAIDYVLKSHSHRELIARIKRILARKTAEADENRFVLQLSDKSKLVLDLLHQRAEINNKQIFLTNIELQLLYILARNANKVLTRNTILKSIWEFEPKESQTLKVHLYRLRKKLSKYISKEEINIAPVRGSGYILSLESSNK